MIVTSDTLVSGFPVGRVAAACLTASDIRRPADTAAELVLAATHDDQLASDVVHIIIEMWEDGGYTIQDYADVMLNAMELAADDPYDFAPPVAAL